MKKLEDKEPFRFEYNRPVSDWYESVSVEIKPTDYIYFRLERRYGPSWWLIGKTTKDEPKYHWVEKQIGEIHNHALGRFIKWAKNPDGRGSRITDIRVISGSFDILEEIKELLREEEHGQPKE